MNIRRAVSALALVAGIAAAAGCAAPPDGPRPQAAPQPPPPALQGFYDQTLDWRPCGPEGGETAFDCTSMNVPLDYADPAGRTAQIAVLRKKATDPARRIGSLVTNPGGPGGSGVDWLAGSADSDGLRELGTRFDLIGFDPRGVGYSTPTVHCFTPAERDQQRATGPDGAAMAAQCAARNDAAVLANIGTREVARDLDVLRAALGDERLSYLGFSYGTSIGTVYAEAFPGNVRALVLDGAVDPSRSALDNSAAQGGSFGRALEDFAVDCTTQPACPLGSDRTTVLDEYEELLAPLADAPAETRLDGRSLSDIDADTAIKSAMYDTDEWGTLRSALADLRAGDGTAMLELADGYEGRGPDGSYDNSAETFLAINCADSLHPARDTEEAATDPCAHWPVPNTLTPHEPHVDGLPQVLVVSTTGDPATPYRDGVTLAKQLGARLLTVEGTQHTAVLSGAPCVDDIAVRYLVDLTLPAKGATCTLDQPAA